MTDSDLTKQVSAQVSAAPMAAYALGQAALAAGLVAAVQAAANSGSTDPKTLASVASTAALAGVVAYFHNMLPVGSSTRPPAPPGVSALMSDLTHSAAREYSGHRCL